MLFCIEIHTLSREKHATEGSYYGISANVHVLCCTMTCLIVRYIHYYIYKYFNPNKKTPTTTGHAHSQYDSNCAVMRFFHFFPLPLLFTWLFFIFQGVLQVKRYVNRISNKLCARLVLKSHVRVPEWICGVLPRIGNLLISFAGPVRGATGSPRSS